MTIRLINLKKEITDVSEELISQNGEFKKAQTDHTTRLRDKKDMNQIQIKEEQHNIY